MIPAESSHLEFVATTHPGMRGKNNEDRYGVASYRTGVNNGVPSVFAIVSDGIGGHRAGEVAAALAVEIITQSVAEIGPSDPINALREGIVRASQVIFDQAEAESEKRGMGATCVCAWVIGNRLYTATVGDSRLYLIRGETIRKLSIDHTWVQEAIEIGLLEPDQARGHPNAHVIRRYLGSPHPVIPDLRLRLNPDETDEKSLNNQGLRLVSEDCLLLCSDGLTDLVDDAEILAALKTKDLNSAINGLVELANERGGHDNITIIALQVPRKVGAAAPVDEPPTIPETSLRRLPVIPITLSCASLGVLLLIALFFLGGFTWWYLNQPSATATLTPTHEPFPTMTPTEGIITPLFPGAPLVTPGLEQTLEIGTPNINPSPPSRPTYTPWPTSTPLTPQPAPALVTPTP